MITRSATGRCEDCAKLDAYDFIGKPLDFEELRVTIQNALEASRLAHRGAIATGEVRRNAGYHEVVAVFTQVNGADEFRAKSKLPARRPPFLIQGESALAKI